MMNIQVGAPVVATATDAVELISLLINTRPLPEALAALDKHAALVPGLHKVRAKVAADDRAGAQMQLQIALDPRPL